MWDRGYREYGGRLSRCLKRSRAGWHDIYRTAGSGHEPFLCHIVAFFVAIRPRHYWQIVEAVQRLEKPGLGGSCGQKMVSRIGLKAVKLARYSGQSLAGLVVQIRPTAQAVELHAPTGVGGSQRHAPGEISPHSHCMKFPETPSCPSIEISTLSISGQLPAAHTAHLLNSRHPAPHTQHPAQGEPRPL